MSDDKIRWINNFKESSSFIEKENNLAYLKRDNYLTQEEIEKYELEINNCKKDPHVLLIHTNHSGSSRHLIPVKEYILIKEEYPSYKHTEQLLRGSKHYYGSSLLKLSKYPHIAYIEFLGNFH